MAQVVFEKSIDPNIKRIVDDLSKFLQDNYTQIHQAEPEFYQNLEKALNSYDTDKINSMFKELDNFIAIRQKTNKQRPFDQFLLSFLKKATSIMTTTGQIFPQYNPYDIYSPVQNFDEYPTYDSSTNDPYISTTSQHGTYTYTNNYTSSYTRLTHSFNQMNLQTDSAFTVQKNQTKFDTYAMKIYEIYYWFEQIEYSQFPDNVSIVFQTLVDTMKKIFTILKEKSSTKIQFREIEKEYQIQISIQAYKNSSHISEKLNLINEKLNAFNEAITPIQTDENLKNDYTYNTLSLDYQEAKTNYMRVNHLINMLEIYYWVCKVNPDYQQNVKKSQPLIELIDSMKTFLVKYMPQPFNIGLNLIEKNYGVYLGKYQRDIKTVISGEPLSKIDCLWRKIKEFSDHIDKFSKEMHKERNNTKFETWHKEYYEKQAFFLVDKNEALEKHGQNLKPLYTNYF